MPNRWSEVKFSIVPVTCAGETTGLADHFIISFPITNFAVRDLSIQNSLSDLSQQCNTVCLWKGPEPTWWLSLFTPVEVHLDRRLRKSFPLSTACRTRTVIRLHGKVKHVNKPVGYQEHNLDISKIYIEKPISKSISHSTKSLNVAFQHFITFTGHMIGICSHMGIACCVGCFRATVSFYNNIVSSIILDEPFFMSIPFKEKASSLTYHNWHSTANSIGPCSCRNGNKREQIPDAPRHSSWNATVREEKTPPSA